MWQDGLRLDTIIPQQDAGTAALLGAVQLRDRAAELRGVARGARGLERPLLDEQAHQRATAVKLRRDAVQARNTAIRDQGRRKQEQLRLAEATKEE